MEQLGHCEVWIRDVKPYYDKFNTINREVGRYYPDHNLFFLGRHKSMVGGWDSVDTLLNYRYMDIIQEAFDKGYDIIVDVNSAFLGPKLLKNIIGPVNSDEVTMIGFYHTDKSEMFKRMNNRRSIKRWDDESYLGTNAQRANNKTSRLLDDDMHWYFIKDRILVNAKEPEDWLLIKYLKEQHNE